MKKLLFTILSVCSIYSYAQYAALDSTFGTNGVTFTNFDLNQGTEGRDLKLLSDGSILTAGFDYGYITPSVLTSYFAISKQKPNGDLDSTFGTNGKTLISFPNAAFSYGKCIQVLSNGKILFGGAVHNNSTGYDFALTRLNANGTIDSQFGNSGFVQTNVSTGSFSDEIRAIAVDANGKIYAAGSATDPNSGRKTIAVCRYNADGTIDNSFVNNGILIIDAASAYNNDSEANDIKFLNASTLIIAGYFRDPFFKHCFVSLDTSGNFNYYNFSNNIGDIYKLAVLNNGKILAVGYIGGPELKVLRLNSYNSIDTTFGYQGYAYINQGFTDRRVYSVTTDSYNNIVACGVVKENPYQPYKMVLFRLKSNGDVDSTFAPNGYYIYNDINSAFSDAKALAIQPDGKIITTGRGVTTSEGFLNLRFNAPYPSTPPPTSIKENSLTKTLVYPNPANNRLNIDLINEAEIEIYAITGKLMDKFAAKQNHIVDISSYPNGMYFVKTQNETIKFVKQ